MIVTGGRILFFCPVGLNKLSVIFFDSRFLSFYLEMFVTLCVIFFYQESTAKVRVIIDSSVIDSVQVSLYQVSSDNMNSYKCHYWTWMLEMMEQHVEFLWYWSFWGSFYRAKKYSGLSISCYFFFLLNWSLYAWLKETLNHEERKPWTMGPEFLMRGNQEKINCSLWQN